MDKEMKSENGNDCRMWNILGVVGFFFIIFVMGIGLWGSRKQFGGQQLTIMTEDASEIFEINLADKGNRGMSFEQKMGEKMHISGRKDAEHGYFEGRIAWAGQKLRVVNSDTGESVMLAEEVRSFMLGDYYVSCRCNAEKKEMEVLIFYCP